MCKPNPPTRQDSRPLCSDQKDKPVLVTLSAAMPAGPSLMGDVAETKGFPYILRDPNQSGHQVTSSLLLVPYLPELLSSQLRLTLEGLSLCLGKCPLSSWKGGGRIVSKG